MKRNIVEEIIYNSADVSPDFSRIEKRLTLPENIRKPRHAPVLKRVLALFLGVLIIGGAVLSIPVIAVVVPLLIDGDAAFGSVAQTAMDKIELVFEKFFPKSLQVRKKAVPLHRF